MGYSPCSWSGVTSTRRSCLDKPVSGLPSDQRRFDWHSLTMDPVDRGAASQGRKGFIHKGDGEGGGIESPPIPSPPCQRTQVWGGGDSHPPLFHRPIGGAPISLFLLTCTCDLARGMPRLSPYGIYGHVGIS
jgi:hypothetical protein